MAFESYQSSLINTAKLHVQQHRTAYMLVFERKYKGCYRGRIRENADHFNRLFQRTTKGSTIQTRRRIDNVQLGQIHFMLGFSLFCPSIY